MMIAAEFQLDQDVAAHLLSSKEQKCINQVFHSLQWLHN